MKSFGAKVFGVGFGEIRDELRPKIFGCSVSEEEIIEAGQRLGGEVFRFVVSEMEDLHQDLSQ